MAFVRKVLNSIAASTGIVVVSDFLPRGSNGPGDTVLPLPGRRQVEDFSCGFAAALMITEHFGRRVSVDRLYSLINPHPTWGASTRKLANALRQCGISVGLRESLDFDSIQAAIAAGSPIITCIRKDGADDSHWCVVYGVSCKPRRVFVGGVGLPHLDDGKVLPWSTFRRMWTPRGNGLVCSPRPDGRRARARRT